MTEHDQNCNCPSAIRARHSAGYYGKEDLPVLGCSCNRCKLRSLAAEVYNCKCSSLATKLCVSCQYASKQIGVLAKTLLNKTTTVA